MAKRNGKLEEDIPEDDWDDENGASNQQENGETDEDLVNDDRGDIMPEVTFKEEPSSDELERIEVELSGSKITQDLVDDPVRMYLREIGRTDLLEPYQEVWLCIIRESSARMERVCEMVVTATTPEIIENSLVELYVKARTSWKKAQTLAAQSDLELPAVSEILLEIRRQQEIVITNEHSIIYSIFSEL